MAEQKAKAVFKEDFEGTNPQFGTNWANNVKSWKANSVAVTTEKAFSGKRSLKLDLSIDGGNYFYWQFPKNIPFWGKLKVRGHIWQQLPSGYKVMLGFSRGVASSGLSGSVVNATMTQKSADGWETWEADASAYAGGDETAYLQGIAIFIYAPVDTKKFSDAHLTFYLDDLEITGDLPAGWKKSFAVKLKAAQEARAQTLLDNGQRALRHAKMALENQLTPLPMATGRWSALHTKLAQYVDNTKRQIGKDVAVLQNDVSNEQAPDRINEKLPLLKLASQSLASLNAYSAQHAELPYLSYVVNPTQDLRILPNSFPVAGVVSTQIKIAASRGEYEAASFAVTADKDLQQVKVNVAPLKNIDNAAVIPVSAIDVRVVKVWWQAGDHYSDTNHPQLTPELLLHDDSFVQVDMDPAKHLNTLKDPQAPRDAKTLQPLDMAAQTTRQFWLTVQVPKATPSGTYEGEIVVSPANAKPLKMTFQVKVYPFDLLPSRFQYGIYYRALLSAEDKPTIGSDLKNEQQFRAELRNMKAHGVLHPTCYTHFVAKPDGTYDFSALKRVLDIYKEEGMDQGPIVLMTPIPTYQFVKADTEELRQKLLQQTRSMTRALVKFQKENGDPQLAIYGIDEATGERLAREKDIFKAILDEGGMTAAAVTSGFYPAIGDLLTLPILSYPDPSAYARVHAAGHQIWTYSIVGAEVPGTMRRNYGLKLWKEGMDGASPYSYQAIEGGNLYDEFHDTRTRAMAFTYPTVDGVIDTVQWEGFREGIDDTRYLTTLLQHIEAAKKDKSKAPVARQAEEWLDHIDINDDLGELRNRMADWIVELQGNEQST